jgi:CheY-like chemotaxis protein
VGDAASALTAVEASPPQRILLDYHLHDSMDGLALARLLRARLPEVPMLLLTADASPALTLRAQALGVPVLAKPVRPAALRAWLGA